MKIDSLPCTNFSFRNNLLFFNVAIFVTKKITVTVQVLWCIWITLIWLKSIYWSQNIINISWVTQPTAQDQWKIYWKMIRGVIISIRQTVRYTKKYMNQVKSRVVKEFKNGVRIWLPGLQNEISWWFVNKEGRRHSHTQWYISQSRRNHQ